MQNPVAVRVSHGPRHLGHQRHAAARFIAQSRRCIEQAAARSEFHAEKWQAVLIDRQNIWMIETRCGLGLATKTGQRLLRFSVKAQHPFESDNAARMPLARAIDHAHAAASDFFQDLIIADAPIGVANIDFVEDHLERFLLLDVEKRALQQTI